MNIRPKLEGIHHLTAITATPAVAVAFYEHVLGLRLIKQTVNFDDPFAYHLYFGDRDGSPGTLLTLFPWDNMASGKTGCGMISAVAFEIPGDAIASWRAWLRKQGLEVMEKVRFGDRVLSFCDPCGLTLDLVASGDSGDSRPDIQNLHSATATLQSLGATSHLLCSVLGFTPVGREGRRYRYAMGNSRTPGRYYDLVLAPESGNGRQGTGSVHHLAFRTRSDEAQSCWRKHLLDQGLQVTGVRDRRYFKSIYFHEPGGVLFEIATDPPGFAIDEAPEQLGRSLMLPPQHQSLRPRLETQLPQLHPKGNHAYSRSDDDQSASALVVALHGTGGNEHELLPLAANLKPGAAVISPRGKPDQHGRLRLITEPENGLFNVPEVTVQARDLADFILATAIRQGSVKGERVALGCDSGATAAAAILMLRPEVFSRAILIQPTMPLTNTPPVHLDGTAVLVLRSRQNQPHPTASTDRLIDTLRAAGAMVEVVETKGSGELSAPALKMAGRWLRRLPQATQA